jgi:hypothetical protein
VADAIYPERLRGKTNGDRMLNGTHLERRAMIFLGIEAKSKTTQTHRRTMSLNRNSPVKFHAIGSVEKLHFTTSGF